MSANMRKLTDQQRMALRTNKAAKWVYRNFPPGQRVEGAPGIEGTVQYHIPMTNAQGGTIVVLWDNGQVGRHSAISLTRTLPASTARTTVPTQEEHQ